MMNAEKMRAVAQGPSAVYDLLWRGFLPGGRAVELQALGAGASVWGVRFVAPASWVHVFLSRHISIDVTGGHLISDRVITARVPDCKMQMEGIDPALVSVNAGLRADAYLEMRAAMTGGKVVFLAIDLPATEWRP